ncbi:hypothetical protein D3C71_1092340 [compost metagenome]
MACPVPSKEARNDAVPENPFASHLATAGRGAVAAGQRLRDGEDEAGHHHRPRDAQARRHPQQRQVECAVAGVVVGDRFDCISLQQGSARLPHHGGNGGRPADRAAALHAGRTVDGRSAGAHAQGKAGAGDRTARTGTGCVAGNCTLFVCLPVLQRSHTGAACLGRPVDAGARLLQLRRRADRLGGVPAHPRARY